ncbi:MAG: radical SAM protein [Oscillospiraceae bacterium]|nr:radical SAM protein [Oscillospiraceae bacterium]
MYTVCDVCFHGCRLKEGQIGLCRARSVMNGKTYSISEGDLTSVALDPIEKKPLKRFHPGSMILSVGSFGCNMRCPFCQNHEISMADKASVRTTGYISPERLCELAVSYRGKNNIGIAFTYNEPLLYPEYIIRTAELLHENGMYCVLVTNGSATEKTFDEILPYTDAMNIDLMTFDAGKYSKLLGGDLETVKRNISAAAGKCHIELTTLIVPGISDDMGELEREAEWIASLCESSDTDIPLHLSRYFPRYRYTAPPTPVETVYAAADIASKYLKYVYVGNC